MAQVGSATLSRRRDLAQDQRVRGPQKRLERVRPQKNRAGIHCSEQRDEHVTKQNRQRDGDHRGQQREPARNATHRLRGDCLASEADGDDVVGDDDEFAFAAGCRELEPSVLQLVGSHIVAIAAELNSADFNRADDVRVGPSVTFSRDRDFGNWGSLEHDVWHVDRKRERSVGSGQNRRHQTDAGQNEESDHGQSQRNERHLRASRHVSRSQQGANVSDACDVPVSLPASGIRQAVLMREAQPARSCGRLASRDGSYHRLA